MNRFFCIIVMLLMIACSTGKISQSKIYNQYPGVPTDSPVTVISFNLELFKDSEINKFLHIVNSEDKFTIKEIYNQSNEMLNPLQKLKPGKYRIYAKAGKIITLSKDMRFEIIINNKKEIYKLTIVENVRMK